MSLGLTPPIAELNIFMTSGLFSSATVIGTEFSSITPSNTQSGSALPAIVAVPLTRILGAAPGAAEVFTTDRPANCPCSISSILEAPTIFRSSVLIVETALVNCLFSICW